MPGETPSAVDTPPAEAGSFPEPSHRSYLAAPPTGEGLVLEPVNWQTEELPPEPELLAAQAQREGLGQVFEPKPAEPEPQTESHPDDESAQEPQEKYSAADGWTISGRNQEQDKIILKRANLDFPSGYEVVRVHPSQYQEIAQATVEPEARPAPAATEPQPQAEAETSPEEAQSDVLVDQQGNLWRYKGKSSETGMHKIESLTENHTKFLTDERMKEFDDFRPEAEPEPQASASVEAEPPSPDPEKEQLHREIQQLGDRIAKLEALLQEKESPYEIKLGGLVPVYSWAKGFESARILEEGERDGESFYKVVTAEGETRTLFKDEVEYWFSHRAEPEAAPKSKEEAQNRFSRKFKSVRDELRRLGGKAKDAVSEAAAPHIEAAKEALSTPLMMGQVIGEKAADAAKEAVVNTILTSQVAAEQAGEAVKNGASAIAGAAKETIVVPALTGQVLAEKAAEDLPKIRRRLIGRAAGYAAVFSVWLLGPSEVPPTADTEDKTEERVESPPLAA